MKVGTDMDMQKQPVSLVTMGERDIMPFSSKSKPKWLKISAIAMGLMVIFGAVALCAVYLGGKVATDTLKESSFVFQLSDGSREIKETISVTDTEEDIRLSDEQTRIVYDYSKGFFVMRLKDDDDDDKCYITSFERRGILAPKDLTSMEKGNITTLTETDYYVDAGSDVDSRILSPLSRKMCAGIPTYWMSEHKSLGSEKNVGRQRRGCHRSCRMYCNCCPRNCGVRCSIVCSW